MTVFWDSQMATFATSPDSLYSQTWIVEKYSITFLTSLNLPPDGVMK